MTLIKRNDPLFGMLDDLFQTDWQGGRLPFHGEMKSVPAVNIREEADRFLVELAAPGMAKDDFQVDLDHNVLTIASEQKQEQESKDEQGRYTRREFNYSSFKRAFTLPESAEVDTIEAGYHDGLLTITIPKREEARQKPVRAIEIK